FNDERRLAGITALDRIADPDVKSAQRSVALLEKIVREEADGHVRTNALISAFAVIKQAPNKGVARTIVESAINNAGRELLVGLSRVLLRHHDCLDAETAQIALNALQDVQSGDVGPVHDLDSAIAHLLDTEYAGLAIDFLTEKLQDDSLNIDKLE